jgi:hypothetical protein
MAGTFNSKTGYMTVNGLTADEINVGKFSVDSDWVASVVTPLLSTIELDSEIVDRIAQSAQEALSITVTDHDSDINWLQGKIVRHDSDFQNMSGKYASILASDLVQQTEITTAQNDILTLSKRVTDADSDIVSNDNDINALDTRLTAAENANATIEARTASLEATVGGATTGHEDRITSLEATIAALQATVAGMSINDLTDVDLTTTTPAIGDVLEWNGTDWVPVATS